MQDKHPHLQRQLPGLVTQSPLFPRFPRAKLGSCSPRDTFRHFREELGDSIAKPSLRLGARLPATCNRSTGHRSDDPCQDRFLAVSAGA
jgi:hypothetical protein